MPPKITFMVWLKMLTWNGKISFLLCKCGIHDWFDAAVRPTLLEVIEALPKVRDLEDESLPFGKIWGRSIVEDLIPKERELVIRREERKRACKIIKSFASYRIDEMSVCKQIMGE